MACIIRLLVTELQGSVSMGMLMRRPGAKIALTASECGVGGNILVQQNRHGRHRHLSSLYNIPAGISADMVREELGQRPLLHAWR